MIPYVTHCTVNRLTDSLCQYGKNSRAISVLLLFIGHNYVPIEGTDTHDLHLLICS